MFTELGHWYSILDGDPLGRWMLNQHYSAYHYKDGRKPKLFMGPGFKMALMTSDFRCLFGWRKFIDASGQQGVNNNVFQKPKGYHILASELILEAEQLAWRRWPNERLYTYVDATEIDSGNPGYCFKKAGWNLVRNEKGDPLLTKVHKRLILEKHPSRQFVALAA